MGTVSAVIPTWNRRELLERVLAALAGQSRPPEEVVVVDNASRDGSAGTARRMGARVIEMRENAGFARAVNRGLAACAGEWVAVVNNDVLPAPDWLERLRAGAGEAWFATGKLLSANQPGVIDGSFDLLCRGGTAWRAGQGRRDGGEWNRRRAIWSAPMTASLFRRELFDKLGPLEERLGSYMEDVEFGLRCALAGYSGVYVPEAVAHHQGSATLGRWHPEIVRLMARNQVLLVAKHYPAGWVRRCGWPVLVAQGLWGLVALRHGRPAAWLRGKWEGWREARRAGWRPQYGLDRLAVLDQSERQLGELQRATGFDWYWRLYFALT